MSRRSGRRGGGKKDNNPSEKASDAIKPAAAGVQKRKRPRSGRGQDAEQKAKRVVSTTAVKIDRSKRCPFLIRIFPSFDQHHRIEDFGKRDLLPKVEFHVHTWLDASLRDLALIIGRDCDFVTSKFPAADAPPGANLEFRFNSVSQADNGPPRYRHLGLCYSTRESPNDQKQLAQTPFVIGDMVSVRIRQVLPETDKDPALVDAVIDADVDKDADANLDRDSDHADAAGTGTDADDPDTQGDDE